MARRPAAAVVAVGLLLGPVGSAAAVPSLAVLRHARATANVGIRAQRPASAGQGGCTLGGLEDRLREVNRLKPQLAATATAAMEADHPLERAWARQVRHT